MNYNKYIKYKSKYNHLKNLKGGNIFKNQRPTFIIYINFKNDINNNNELKEISNIEIVDDVNYESIVNTSHTQDKIFYYFILLKYNMITSNVELNLVNLQKLIILNQYNIILLFNCITIADIKNIFNNTEIQALENFKFIRLYNIVQRDTIPSKEFYRYNDKFEDIINITFGNISDQDDIIDIESYKEQSYQEKIKILNKGSNIKYMNYQWSIGSNRGEKFMDGKDMISDDTTEYSNMKYLHSKYNINKWIIQYIDKLHCNIKVFKQFYGTCQSNAQINLLFTGHLGKWLLYCFSNEKEQILQLVNEKDFLTKDDLINYNAEADIKKLFTSIDKISTLDSTTINFLNKIYQYYFSYNINYNHHDEYSNSFERITDPIIKQNLIKIYTKYEYKVKYILYSYINIFIIEKYNLVISDHDILQPLKFRFLLWSLIKPYILNLISINDIISNITEISNKCLIEYNYIKYDDITTKYAKNRLVQNYDLNASKQNFRDYKFIILLYALFPNDISLTLPKVNNPDYEAIYKLYNYYYIINDNPTTNIIIIPLPIFNSTSYWLNESVDLHNGKSKKLYELCSFNYNDYELIGCMLVTKIHSVIGFKCNNKYYIYNSNNSESILYDWYETNPANYSYQDVIFMKKEFYKFLSKTTEIQAREAEAETKAREEAERKARQASEEAEKQAREAEAETKAREEAERKARQASEEAERKARQASEEAEKQAARQTREETKRKAARPARQAKQAREEAARQAKQAREEAERKAKQAREEAERKTRQAKHARKEAERKARQAKQARDEAERKAIQAKQAREEAERKAARPARQTSPRQTSLRQTKGVVERKAR